MFRKLLFFFLILFVIPALRLKAQSSDSIKKMLVGSWASIDKNATRIITFYHDGKFQEEITAAPFKSWKCLLSQARWKIKGKKKFILLYRHSFNPDETYCVGLIPLLISDGIVHLTSDTLAVKALVRKRDNTYADSVLFFKRIALRTSRLYHDPQPNNLFLINPQDSTKTIKIASYLDEHISIQLRNDTLQEYSSQASGYFIGVHDDTLKIKCESEYLSFTDINGKGQSKELIIDNNANLPIRSYCIKNIYSITPRLEKHPVLSGIGGTVATLSVASAFLASPLFASAPHFNSFDTHQFLLFSGISLLSGLVIGVPLIAIGHGPTTEYYLDPIEAKKNDAPCWRIKPFVYE
ncbi:MAG: hypothetical protein ACHQRM_00235 [Bacteroidia bacterium]